MRSDGRGTMIFPMKKILVFAPHADFADEPAFRIRLLNLREAMRCRGYEFDIQVRPKTPWGRLALARTARHYAGVILHRRMLDGYEARALRRNLPRPGRIFMDLDDATMIHQTKLGVLARRRLDRRFAATVGILDVACVGNAYLAKIFAERGVRTALIPSVVNPAAYRVKDAGVSEGATLVWIGSRSTVQYLEESFPALEAAAGRVRNLRLVAICDVPPTVYGALPVEHIPWSERGEAEALLRGDIGIAPMPENAWTLGKCGFKIVQYMAAGLPVIASPVGINAELVQPEAGARAGLLPAAWGEWPAAIAQLAGDAGLRAQYGAAGRKRVEGELSIEQAAERWARVLA